MSRLCRHVVGLLALGACGLSLLCAGPASGAGTGAVADCNTNLRLTQHYTVAQLRTALTTMPADIKQYTNCYDVIQRQLLAQLGLGGGGNGGGTGDGSGGSFLPTPVIILLLLLVLVAGGFALAAVRRRGSSGGGAADADGEPRA